MAKRHPNKHIQAAISYAIENGWRLVASNGHAFGILFCAHADRDGCQKSVWSTPRNPENHAKEIRRVVDRCPH